MGFFYTYGILFSVILVTATFYGKAYWHFQLRRRLNPDLAEAKFLHLFFNPLLFFGNSAIFFPIYIKFKDFSDPDLNKLQDKVMHWVKLFWFVLFGMMALAFIGASFGKVEFDF